MVQRRWVDAARPAELARHDGLAYSLWLPDATSRAGVVILHGAGSCKESHHDYARKLLAHGFASVAFDQRGHGESDGRLDGRALEDIASMAGLLRDRLGGEVPLALRGSSMGGYLAMVAAPEIDAGAVVAICPAAAEGLRRGLRSGALGFDADAAAVDQFLADHDLYDVAPGLAMPVLLLHAEGDEQVPVEHSRELAALMRHPGSRLLTVPGGHHRSVQHDEELQAVSVKFLEGALG